MRGYVHREQNFSCLLVKILWVFTGVGSQNGPGGQCVFFPLSTCIPRWSKRASMSILVSTCTGRRPLDWHKRSCPYPKHHHTSSDAGTCKRAVPVRTTAVHRHPIFCRLSSSLGHKTSRSQKMQPPPQNRAQSNSWYHNNYYSTKIIYPAKIFFQSLGISC